MEKHRKNVEIETYDRLTQKQLMLVKVYYIYPDWKFEEIVEFFGDIDDWVDFNPEQCDDDRCDDMIFYLLNMYQEYEMAGE